ncbi:unnamed protein product, partial [Brassica rapa]
REGESHRISGSSSSSSFRFSSRSCLWLSLSSRRVDEIRVVLTAHGVSVEAGRTFYRSGCVIIILKASFLR